MSIKFLCPNGHQLTCGDDRAGKPGKCPKCGTAFVVPNAEEVAAAASNGAATRNETAASKSSVAAGASGKSAGAGGKSSAGAGSTSGVSKNAPLPPGQIVFLCPNGHRLNGPKSLQGKAGQCPHCGEKFRIPIYEEDEVPQEEIQEFPAEEAVEETGDNAAAQGAAEDEIPVGTAVENDPAEESEAVETFPEEVEIVDTIEEVSLVPTSVGPTVPPLPPGPSHQLFDVFSRLWALKPEDAVVELVLKDGKTLQPAKYSPTLSRQAFGVFATQEEDGTFRLLTISWETVVRIEFANLQDLPPGVFA